MLLTGKVALVTGSGRGIWAAICLVLARQGATDTVNYSASAENAEQAARLGIPSRLAAEAALESD